MPADIADFAQEFTDHFLEKSIARQKYTPRPLSGECLHCGEKINEGRFCGTPCRDDYEAERKRKSRNGYA